MPDLLTWKIPNQKHKQSLLPCFMSHIIRFRRHKLIQHTIKTLSNSQHNHAMCSLKLTITRLLLILPKKQ